MEGLINVQLDLHNSIKRDLSNFKKSAKERISKEYVEIRSESLETDWLSFRANHAKLFEISQPDILASTQYVVKEIYDITKDHYFNYKSLLIRTLNQLRSTESQSSPSTNSDKVSPLVKLPKITIPIFSGSYSEWTTFRDLFVSLVHNNTDLDNVQKLNYLKAHITGEAEQLIRHTPITSANYSRCWSLLEQRYNNKKYLAKCIFKRLFSIKQMNTESASGLKDLIDTTIDCLNALKNIDIDVSTWDIIIIHIVTFKLDSETRKQWELHISSLVDSNQLPTLEQFKTFMENRFRALEFVDSKKPSVQYNSGSSSKPRSFKATNTSVMRCEYCSEQHKLCFCKRFAGEDIATRRDFVAKNSICVNCLGSNHISSQCRNPGSCRICKSRHHSLLHQEIESTASSSTAEKPVESTSTLTNTPPIVSCLSTQRISSCGQVLLPTALVNTESEAGKDHILRVLLDQGSQASFITEAAVQLLRLKKTPVSGMITGLGGNKAIRSKYVVTIKLRSRTNQDNNIQVTAYVLKNITTFLPERQVHNLDWTELKNLQLADPHFNTPKAIDMLLGANIYSQTVQEGIKKSRNGKLIAQRTTLGWILSGTVNEQFNKNNEDTPKISVMHAQVTETKNSKRIEVEQKFKPRTPNRTDEGRNRTRHLNVTKTQPSDKRLSKNLDLKQIEHNRNLQLGHIKSVNINDRENNETVYLPHHAFVRNDKTTLKEQAEKWNNNKVDILTSIYKKEDQENIQNHTQENDKQQQDTLSKGKHKQNTMEKNKQSKISLKIKKDMKNKNEY
ncbi:uncharacterized protein LOC123867223 [Maniola jurtina]|uniref:uncharacterized protein LOC123867223 n=1 Tax=Maniola jurtina TaxID=191418 RepID=UPI001E688F9E|nr:uncharacterized protein LOC123867223 [Maniola jurtina]